MRALSERQFRNALLGAFILLSWMTLWIWSRTPYGQHFHHSGTGTFPILIFALGWTLMTIAMMLPTSFPLLALFHTMLGDRTNRVWLVGLCVAGYLISWVVFGILANFGVAQLQFLVVSANFQTVLLVVAGVYQFTPLKYYCLRKCRSPLSFILSHWHGRNEASESFRLGAHHGLFCIGCCWSLMLLMFGAVAIHFLWMLGLGTLMAIEKNVSWGNRISSPLGVLLMVSAVILRFAQ
jgi:predicted metal-binding membrane protein